MLDWLRELHARDPWAPTAIAVGIAFMGATLIAWLSRPQRPKE